MPNGDAGTAAARHGRGSLAGKDVFRQRLQPRIVPNSRGKRRKPGSRDLTSVLHTSYKQFISFLQGCLDWDKNSRLTPEQALQHPWLAESVSAPAASQSHPARAKAQTI